MAKILEETIGIKLSRLVKTNESQIELLTDDQRYLLLQTILQVCEEVLSDNSVVVELE